MNTFDKEPSVSHMIPKKPSNTHQEFLSALEDAVISIGQVSLFRDTPAE
jgi:hypothetical protein